MTFVEMFPNVPDGFHPVEWPRLFAGSWGSCDHCRQRTRFRDQIWQLGICSPDCYWSAMAVVSGEHLAEAFPDAKPGEKPTMWTQMVADCFYCDGCKVSTQFIDLRVRRPVCSDHCRHVLHMKVLTAEAEQQQNTMVSALVAQRLWSNPIAEAKALLGPGLFHAMVEDRTSLLLAVIPPSDSFTIGSRLYPAQAPVPVAEEPQEVLALAAADPPTVAAAAV
jgi:hypothetical protein